MQGGGEMAEKTRKVPPCPSRGRISIAACAAGALAKILFIIC